MSSFVASIWVGGEAKISENIFRCFVVRYFSTAPVEVQSRVQVQAIRGRMETHRLKMPCSLAVSGPGLGRAAFHRQPVLQVVIGCIPFFLKWEEVVVEGGTKN